MLLGASNIPVVDLSGLDPGDVAVFPIGELFFLDGVPPDLSVATSPTADTTQLSGIRPISVSFWGSPWRPSVKSLCMSAASARS